MCAAAAASAEELEALLQDLAENVHSRDFRDLARSFEQALKSSPIPPQEKQPLWARYQDLWSARKSWSAERASASSAAFRSYEYDLRRLDDCEPILPIGQTYYDWLEIGPRVRLCRGRLHELLAAIREDGTLTHTDRKRLFGEIDDKRNALSSREETAFHAGAQHAGKLLNDAETAVRSSPTREAFEVLKQATAEFRSLYLKRSDRDMCEGAFQRLWDQLKAKREDQREAAHRKHEEWRSRQEEGLERLRGALDKAEDALGRVRSNIYANEEKLSDARTPEFEDRVRGWIADGRQKETDIERSIETLKSKIRDAEDRLRR